MQPGIKRTTLAFGEDHKWLASKHGSENGDDIMLDGAACLAVYTDGLTKSGTILAKQTSTGRYVPYTSGGTDGAGTAVGVLYESVFVGTGTDNKNALGSLLRHCQVNTALLPRTAAQVGGPAAGAITDLKGQIIFVEATN